MRRYPLYHFLFWLTLFLSGGLFTFIFLFFFKVYTHLIMSLTSILVTIKLGNLTPLFSEKDFYLNILLFSLSSILVISFFLGIAKIWYLSLKTKKFVRKHLNQKNKVSQKLQKVLTEIKLSKVVEVKSKGLEIFCFGFFKPQICISSSLVKLLSPLELKAVLIHEKTHLKNYDPLKILILKTLDNFFFYNIGLKTLVRKFLLLGEILADSAAIRYFKTSKYLLKALIKILEKPQNVIYPEGVGPFNVTEERIKWLTEDKSYYFPLKKTFLKYTFSFSVAVTVLIFITFSMSLINCSHPFKCFTAAASAAEVEEENLAIIHQVNNQGSPCDLDYYNSNNNSLDFSLNSP